MLHTEGNGGKIVHVDKIDKIDTVSKLDKLYWRRLKNGNNKTES